MDCGGRKSPSVQGGDVLRFFWCGWFLLSLLDLLQDRFCIMFCFVFLALRHVGSNLHPLQWKANLIHWTTREVPRVEVLKVLCFHFPLTLLSLGMHISLVDDSPSAKILEGEMHEADINLTPRLESDQQLTCEYEMFVMEPLRPHICLLCGVTKAKAD